MEKCIFCEIAAGRMPASIVYEDNMTIAFMDAFPASRGHVLIIPRRHFETLNDMDETTGCHLFQVAMRVEQAIRNTEELACAGTNLLMNNGAAAGQEIRHAHLHIIPRYAEDKLRLSFGHPERGGQEALDALADAIEAAL
jgi:histidine triad (HIT) family protein